MIIIKTPKTTHSKTKIRKFDLKSNIEIEELNFANPKNLNIKEFNELIQKNIDICNKRLERSRLLCRSIECSTNRNFLKLSDHMIQKKINRTNGYYLSTIDSENGIYIH